MRALLLAALLIACGGDGPRPTTGVVVRCAWDGASPAQVEAMVAIPVERALSSLANVATITSRSEQGVATVTVEVKPGHDATEVAMAASRALQQTMSELPREANPPVVTKQRLDDRPVLALALRGDLAPEAMARLADHEIVREVERLVGVGRVEERGFVHPAVIVRPDLARLLAMDVTPVELGEAIAGTGVNVPGGRVDDAGMVVRIRGQRVDLATIEDTVIKEANGVPVKLRDVATVERGVERLAHPEPAMIAVYAQLGAPRREVRDRVREKLRSLALPAGVTLEELAAPVEQKPLPLAATIVGPDHALLEQFADEVVDELAATKVTVVRDPGPGTPDIQLDVDRASATRFGVSVGDVADAVRFALGEDRVAYVTMGDDELPVIVRLPDKAMPDRLAEVFVRSHSDVDDGMKLPLTQLVDVTQRLSRPLLRRDLVRAIDLRASSDAAKQVRSRLAQHASNWPAGYRIVVPR